MNFMMSRENLIIINGTIIENNRTMRQMMVGIFLLGIIINLCAFGYVIVSLNKSELKGMRGDAGPRGPIGDRGATGDPGPVASRKGPN